MSAQEVRASHLTLEAASPNLSANTGRHLDTGWNVDINSATLNSLGFPDGRVRFWSVTLDHIVHLNPKGPVDFYLFGGGGLYHRTQEFTQPTVAVGHRLRSVLRILPGDRFGEPGAGFLFRE
jgi:hypothetical protein